MSVKSGAKKGNQGTEEIKESVAQLEKSAAAVDKSVKGVEKAVKKYAADTEKALEESAGRQEAAAALLSVTFGAQIKADRKTKTNAITDDMILQAAAVVEYPAWEVGKAYTVGDIVTSSGLIFEVVAAHTSNAAYPVETTFAYYRLVELSHAGTQEDPIPYPEAAGILVKVENGKYYGYKGAVYLAKADMPNCVYPPDTAGMWQWEKVKK